MSLIADALRKAESASPPAQSPAPGSRSVWFYRSLLIVGIGLVLAGLGLVTQRPGGRFLPPTGSNPAAPAAPLLRPGEGKLFLSGIIQGGNGKSLAVINNEILEEGQSVRGATVTRIAQREVEIQEGERVRTLKLRD